MNNQTLAVFIKGYCGAQCFALNGGWSSLTEFQRELCLTDQQIEENYFQIDDWPLGQQEEPALERITAVMVFGDPSRAYFSSCLAQVKDALALVSETEYEKLL